MNKLNYMDFEEIRRKGDLLFESIRGSHLFGLNTETSDIDTFGVFCGPEEWFLGSGKDRKNQVQSEKCDDYWDELGKYFFELGKSNPEALVSLFTPEKHILHFDPILKPLWEIRDQLLTKECFKSFSGYAYSQIKKAKGLKKAINTDPETVKERKTPLHFCMVPQGIGTVSLIKWLSDSDLFQEYCGISRLSNTTECYSLFYDWGAAEKDGKNIPEEFKGRSVIGYRGILCKDDPLTSQLRLSSIPKEENPLCWFQFNHNSYTSHCVDYKRYWDWVKNRNEDRYNLNKGHNYDCYLESLTWFLTQEGWKRYEDVKDTDKIGCFDKTGNLAFSPILSRTKYTQKDEEKIDIYYYSDDDIKFSVTENHRLYLRREDEEDYKLITAEEWKKNSDKYKYYQLQALRENNKPDNPDWTEDDIRFLVIIIIKAVVSISKGGKAELLILQSYFKHGKRDLTEVGLIEFVSQYAFGGEELLKSVEFNGSCRCKDLDLIKNKKAREIIDKVLYRNKPEKAIVDEYDNPVSELLLSFGRNQIKQFLTWVELYCDSPVHIRKRKKKSGCSWFINSSPFIGFLRLDEVLGQVFRLIGGFDVSQKPEIIIVTEKEGDGNLIETYLDPKKLVVKDISEFDGFSQNDRSVVCFETEHGTLITLGDSMSDPSILESIKGSSGMAFHGNSKNISHCVRIFTMAKEIAEGKGMILDRTGIDRDFLLSIKNHELEYDKVMEYVENLRESMEESFIKSQIPDTPDLDLLDRLQIDIRKKHYGRKRNT